MLVMASALGEPVVCVIHQIKTNWVSELPINEKAWPVQMKKKRGFQSCDWGCDVFCNCIATP
jgi:hypothetical protein